MNNRYCIPEKLYNFMSSTAVNNYIAKRYDRWLDYASYHCGLVGISDEAHDVLNEVLCSLLQKSDRLLEKLLSTKKNGYTELDFFVLRMIKLNVTSPTSPYQSKYKRIPADDNADYSRMDIEDVPDNEIDTPGITLERMHQVREVFESLDLSPLAKRVFEFHFFQDNNFSEWVGPESQKQLYEMYNGVQELIKKKVKGEFIF